MLGFLARECGWNHKKILDEFTLDQLYGYYRLISVEKMKEERLRALAMAESMAYAFGSSNQREFTEFLDRLYENKTNDIDKSIEDAKSMGLPVEEI